MAAAWLMRMWECARARFFFHSSHLCLFLLQVALHFGVWDLSPRMVFFLIFCMATCTFIHSILIEDYWGLSSGGMCPPLWHPHRFSIFIFLLLVVDRVDGPLLLLFDSSTCPVHTFSEAHIYWSRPKSVSILFEWMVLFDHFFRLYCHGVHCNITTNY